MNPTFTPTPLFTRRAELVLCWLAAGLLGLSVLLGSGCANYGHAVKPATMTQLAACTLLDRLPESAGYLTAASRAFTVFFGSTNLPSPADVRAVLAALPNVKLTPAQQTALWAATCLAYEAAWRGTVTPADTVTLRYTLAEIADALRLAVAECGPPPQTTIAARAQSTAAIDEQGLFDLAKTIGKEIKARNP